jgi:AcrR family transcriptional regulator
LTTRIPAPPSTMRKEPQQARSRAMTAAILQATARILDERGWAGLTTNAVAEVAGASIGSLYQYFPNKLALIEAVRRRHFDEVLAVSHHATDNETPRARRIETFVDGMIAVHSRHPAANRVLLEEAPRGEDSSLVHDRFVAEYHNACEALFTANRRGNLADDPRIAAQVLAAAVAGVVHDAVRQRTLGSPVLRQELTWLVESYLSRRQRSAL